MKAYFNSRTEDVAIFWKDLIIEMEKLFPRCSSVVPLLETTYRDSLHTAM